MCRYVRMGGIAMMLALAATMLMGSSVAVAASAAKAVARPAKNSAVELRWSSLTLSAPQVPTPSAAAAARDFASSTWNWV